MLPGNTIGRLIGAGDPFFSFVKLLAGFNGTNGSVTFVDESPVGRANAVASGTPGDAVLSTAQFKFGTASLRVQNGASANWSDSADWILASSNSDQYTVEFWIRFNTMVAGRVMIGQRNIDTTYAWSMQTPAGSSSEFEFKTSPDGTIASLVGPTSSGAGLTTGVWYHLAVDKDATGKIRLYKDGVMVGSSTPANSAVFNSGVALSTGAAAIAVGSDCWIDEVRITKGVARYASDGGFTVPTAAFPRS